MFQYGKTRKIRLIGYWHSKDYPNYPDPAWFIDPTWDLSEKKLVIRYLISGITFLEYEGFSWCRFRCGASHIGTKELSDGIYYWPEGLVHYIEQHQVKLPKKFLRHVKKNQFIKPDSVRERIGCEPSITKGKLAIEAMQARLLLKSEKHDKSGNRMMIRTGVSENFWVCLDESWWKKLTCPDQCTTS